MCESNERWIGWHFLPAGRHTRWNRTEVTVGSVLREERPLRMCEVGLHASQRAIDALLYAPGPIVCLVELRGKRLDQEDKSCAAERKCLAMADATQVLHEFACWCAEQALEEERKAGREPNPRSWEAVRVKRRWLKGEATGGELTAARAAAWAAADAAWDAARAAAGAAADAAWAAADAAWDAADVARAAAYVAWDAARDAAYAAYAARRSRTAARWQQNEKLEKMLLQALGCDKEGKKVTQ